jgi:hypothetical protein
MNIANRDKYVMFFKSTMDVYLNYKHVFQHVDSISERFLKTKTMQYLTPIQFMFLDYVICMNFYFFLLYFHKNSVLTEVNLPIILYKILL